ncbi:MAG: carboxypeptidase regulatory-like domain-containing protein [Gemmatimonadales bacterium]
MKRLLIPAVLILWGCGGEGGAGGEAGGGAPAAEPLGTAVIAGAVRFEGTPPANPEIDMSDEPACAEAHGEMAVSPQVVVSDGRLANVFVRVTSGLPDGPYPMPSTPAVIDQRGCLYEPRVLGVMVDQPLEIRNSDSLLHNIKAVPSENRGFNISQPTAGMTSTRRFSVPEVMVPFECNVHGWMMAFVGVVEHPYFGTSGTDGAFRIEGLPAGTYTLEAWHERLGTQTAEVTVADGETASVTFTFTAPTS